MQAELAKEMSALALATSKAEAARAAATATAGVANANSNLLRGDLESSVDRNSSNLTLQQMPRLRLPTR